MQTLVAQIAFTFVDDAIVLTTGLGRLLGKLAIAPVERIARTCDVAGVLTTAGPAAAASRRPRSNGLTMPVARSRRRGLFGILSGFRALSKLT